LNGLALCTGYGGIERGLESRIDGFRTVCHVEGEAYAASVLIKKIQEGTIYEAPVWSNVKTFNGEPWRSKVDIITGGFPCQPHSSAGKLLAEEDPRNLWPDVKRIISEVRPRFLFLENVSNINNTIAPSIVGDLAEMGFESAWCVVRAADVGAPHRRARWFIMAVANPNHSNEPNMRINESFEGTQELEEVIIPDTNGERRSENKFNIRGGELDSKRTREKVLSDTSSERSGKGGFLLQRTNRKIFDRSSQKGWWEIEPRVGRMVDGVAHWVDRLRGCGNGVVPQQASYAFDILSTALLNAKIDDYN